MKRTIKRALGCLLTLVMVLSIAYFPIEHVKADTNRSADELLGIKIATNPVKLYQPSDTREEKYKLEVQVVAKENISVENLTGSILVDNTILANGKTNLGLKEWDNPVCTANGAGKYEIELNAPIESTEAIAVNKGEALFSITFEVVGKATSTVINFMDVDLKFAENVRATSAAISPVSVTSDGAAEKQYLNIKFDKDTFDTTADTITIPVKIAKNDGFNNIYIELTYDLQELELVSFDWDENFKLNNKFVGYRTDGTGNVSLTALNNNSNGKNFDVSSDVLCNAVFKFKNNSARGAVTATVKEANNVGGERLETNGTITCYAKQKQQDDIKYGDVNGDGDVTLVDAQWVLEACNHVRTLNEKQEAAAKVTGRSYVSLQDARAIMQLVTKKIDKFPVQKSTP